MKYPFTGRKTSVIMKISKGKSPVLTEKPGETKPADKEKA